MLSRQNLHRYQEQGVEFIIEHPNAALFLDMGLGKSVTTLTAISELIDNVEITNCLVVAPKKVAESTWAQEAQKWGHLRHLKTSRVLGTATQRERALNATADVYITSRDLLVWVLERAKALKKDFDMLVLDELTSFKNSSAKRFKALRKARPFIPRCVGLTGTPAPNGLVDLWAQMYCVDMGESLGLRKTSFIDAYFDTFRYQGVVIKCTPKKGAEKEIYARLRHNTLTMTAEDYLDLPDMIEIDTYVELPTKLMEKYKSFERENVLAYADTVASDDSVLIANSAAALCNKLCQYANGAVYNDDKQAVKIHNEKIDSLVSIIETARENNESVLLFYQYKHDCEYIFLDERLKDYRIRKYQSESDLVDWNDGKIDVLLSHPASTAYGLNLQKGGHIIVWFGTGWNAELYQQGNARLHRQGQDKPTIVYRLVTRDTMDEAALRAVTHKVSSQTAMLDALKKKIIAYETT